MLFILFLRRIIRHAFLWFALAALLALSGCSAIKVVYNNADDLIYWWLDGYADLQDGQKQLTRDALDELHRWHRQQQLPQYVALLQRMQHMAPNDLSPAQVCAVAQDMKDSFIRVLRHVEPASAQLASQLKPEQLRSVRQRFDKTNKEWRADWLDPDEQGRLRYRTQQATQRLEDFYGRLDQPQQEALRQWLSQSVFDPAASYAERERRQADTLQTLQRIAQQGPAQAEQAQALLHALVERNFHSPNESARTYSNALWNDNCAGFAKFHNSTTTAQREHMVQTLRGYERDFRVLMSAKP